MGSLVTAVHRTEKSITEYQHYGDRREKMLEQNASRLDELLKKSRSKRQKVPYKVKEAIEEKVFFAKMKNELIEEAKKKRDYISQERDEVSLRDFSKLIGGGEKGEHLFNVGYFRNKRNGSRGDTVTQNNTGDYVGDLNRKTQTPYKKTRQQSVAHLGDALHSKKRITFTNTRPQSRQLRQQSSIEALYSKQLKCTQEIDPNESLEQINTKVDMSVERAYYSKQAKAIKAREINSDMTEKLAKITQEKEVYKEETYEQYT